MPKTLAEKEEDKRKKMALYGHGEGLVSGYSSAVEEDGAYAEAATGANETAGRVARMTQYVAELGEKINEVLDLDLDPFGPFNPPTLDDSFNADAQAYLEKQGIFVSNIPELSLPEGFGPKEYDPFSTPDMGTFDPALPTNGIASSTEGPGFDSEIQINPSGNFANAADPFNSFTMGEDIAPATAPNNAKKQEFKLTGG